MLEEAIFNNIPVKESQKQVEAKQVEGRSPPPFFRKRGKTAS
jgi:hypothetical protein